MKTNKGHIVKVLLFQMIVVPVVLTLGLFTIPLILRMLTSLGLGKYTYNFVLLIIGIIASWTVGCVIGMIFSKNHLTNSSTDKIKYVIPMIPIVYALFFAALVMLLSRGSYNSGWWLLYVLKNPAFLIFDFVIAFSGYFYMMTVAEITAYTGFLFGIFLYEYIFVKDRKQMPKRAKTGFAMVLISVILLLGVSSREVINNGLIEIVHGESTVGNDLTEYDLMQIAPFREDNGLAKLEREASLQFIDFDTMPRLDGATAAYPVYASFVEAVYVGLGEYFDANKYSDEKDVYTAFVGSQEYPFSIVQCTKTGTAYERLIKGETDIIFVAEPSKAHSEEVRAQGDDFILTQIGSEAFVFFTNASNSVDNLSIKQLQEIYSGEITNWKEVGGRNVKILPYQRPQNSGSQTVMENRVMKDIKMQDPTKETFAGGMGEIISRVSGYKNARNSLGYSFMYYSSEMVKNNQIKYIAIDGIKPTQETIINHSYPFTVPVYAVTLASNKDENVHIFLEWILSEEGQSLVEKTGYTRNIN